MHAATQSGFGRGEAAAGDQSWIAGIGGGFFAGATGVVCAAVGGGEACVDGSGVAPGVGGSTGGGSGAVAAAPGGGADLIAGVSAGLSTCDGFVSCVANSGGRDRGKDCPLGAGAWECASGGAGA